MKKNTNNDIHCVFQGIGGNGNIYISGFKSATDNNLIKNLNIKAIISASLSNKIDTKVIQIDHYLHIPALDSEQFNISDYFQKTYNFIQQARKTTNVLVHCQAGISRSSTIVLAYLMKKYKYSCNQLLALLKRKRKQINPNRGFIKQLEQYQIKLKLQKKKQFNSVITSILRQSRQKLQRKSHSVPLSFRKKQQQQNNNQNQQNRQSNHDNKTRINKLDKQIRANANTNVNTNDKIKKQQQRCHSSFIVCKSVDIKQSRFNRYSQKIIQKTFVKQKQKIEICQNINKKQNSIIGENISIQSKQRLESMTSQFESPSIFNRINISSTTRTNSKFFQNTKDLQAKINRIKDKLARQYEKNKKVSNRESNQKNERSSRSNKWKYLRVSSSPNKQSINNIDSNQNQLSPKKQIRFQIRPSSIQMIKQLK